MAQTLKQFKLEQEKISEKRLSTDFYPRELTIVAEGDSWFDYPLKIDIIDNLIKDGFAIKNLAKAGDTLENMVYGTQYRKVPKDNVNITHPGPESLQATLLAIRTLKPKIVLFSAGGNDIVGSEMINYLNHKHSKPDSLVNEVIIEEKLVQMKKAITFFIESVHRTDKDTRIIMDGYDYAKVNGKGYRFLFIKYIRGPWIQPAMGAKAITDPADQNYIIRYLVDAYNNMLNELDKQYKYFHHIDLRGTFPNDNEWDNEIHLKNKGYRKVADIYREKINKVLGGDPVEEFKERIFV